MADLDALPDVALSVRQPWAWAIIHAGKDVENRGWRTGSASGWLRRRGRVAIHASKGMTRREYIDAYCMMANTGVACPREIDLPRGGIIGSVEIVDVVRESASPWFYGPVGLVLRAPQPCEFTSARGALGFFLWRPLAKLPV
jgi:hypothetical protein